MMRIFLIALCGAGGALLRYGLGEWSAGALLRRGSDFPLGILCINVAGSFALSLLVTLVSRGLPKEWGLALGVGFLGAFTTYSTFAVGAEKMIGAGQWRAALFYVGGTLGGGWAAVVAGRWLALKLS